MNGKIPVAVLGATGAVGQRIVGMLADHPWFTLTAAAASGRSVGKSYAEATSWLLPEPMPEAVRSLPVLSCDPSEIDAPLLFSALDASVAGEIELAFEADGRLVSTNARNHRMRADVPLVIPEINAAHLGLLAGKAGKCGAIVANPNCSTIGLALALAPLEESFGLTSVSVATLQAISGAGYPGLPSLDILDNALPFIAGEEKKLESEPLKIFGKLCGEFIEPAPIKLSAACSRVAVSDGHLLRISVKLGRPADPSELLDAWASWRGAEIARNLPSAPERAVVYRSERDRPQPRLDRNAGKGMTVSVGGLGCDAVLDYKFTALVHNTIRGAAGGTLLLAELAVAQGLCGLRPPN